MTDLKHYGLSHRRRAADRPLDGFLTGIAWFIVTLLVIFYGLGAVPAHAGPSINMPQAIADALVVSCAELQTVEKSGDRYFIGCRDVLGRDKTFIFRIDSAGYVYLEGGATP